MSSINSDSINADIIMIGTNPIEYYDSYNEALPSPSTEYVEDLIDFMQKQKDVVLNIYENIFTNEATQKTDSIIHYEIKLPENPIIIYKTCGICAFACFFLLSTLCFTILISAFKKNKKNINIVEAEPLSIKPIEIKKIDV